MFYFISGKDSFRSSLYFNEVVSFYKKGDISFLRVDFLDKFTPILSVAQIRNFLGSNTLFSSLKLLILENLFRGMALSQRKELWNILKEKNIGEKKDVMVIIYEEDEVKASTFQKWLGKKSKGVKVFSPLRGKKLEQWLKEQVEKMEVQLSPAARNLLLASFPNDSGLLYHSLEKLALLPSGRITRKDVEDNIFLPLSSSIFDLLDKIGQKKVDQAYEILVKELKKGTFPLIILKMIILEFRNLLKLKTISAHSFFEAQRKVHLHPYVLRKTYPLAKKFDISFLKKMYRRLLYYDEKVKQGTIDGQIALEMFLLDFSK